jgi:hypothetical protein
MALATGTGAEVQRPLATIVIGGLITCTAHCLLVMPAITALMSATWPGAGKGMSAQSRMSPCRPTTRGAGGERKRRRPLDTKQRGQRYDSKSYSLLRIFTDELAMSGDRPVFEVMLEKAKAHNCLE